MPKATKESEKTIEKNLEYIGLNLNKLPTFLKECENLNFRPSKAYDDTIYKVYKYSGKILVNMLYIFLSANCSEMMLDF